ncbi:hypothetical protein RCL_jg25450.t1 [Rhizophagus clarus]|uniref:Uncharacterized protein n=1 Tax=Rhizophagus clarus TaxID=94130 RepID=A0A8H3LA53_9GLOM|nr:hypothetical protein RCL_jg25450.t1 [Rhizophagus clarus]
MGANSRFCSFLIKTGDNVLLELVPLDRFSKDYEHSEIDEENCEIKDGIQRNENENRIRNDYIRNDDTNIKIENDDANVKIRNDYANVKIRNDDANVRIRNDNTNVKIKNNDKNVRIRNDDVNVLIKNNDKDVNDDRNRNLILVEIYYDEKQKHPKRLDLNLKICIFLLWYY